ncbi:hypothetical protein A0H76_1184 [Hepatospora eriocheir]|uniref:Uncharacterized protein n=1 Tax=Hepatospora eriocheir TaxID=1081669 RepID=A0A1X0QHQ5_9MICR|nr:hypothetical protein A0H76_1184 [Hepatospora eriocheir]
MDSFLKHVDKVFIEDADEYYAYNVLAFIFWLIIFFILILLLVLFIRFIVVMIYLYIFRRSTTNNSNQPNIVVNNNTFKPENITPQQVDKNESVEIDTNK